MILVNMVHKNGQYEHNTLFLFQQLDQATLSLAVREDYLDNSTEAKSVSFTQIQLCTLSGCYWVHKLLKNSCLFTENEQCGYLFDDHIPSTGSKGLLLR